MIRLIWPRAACRSAKHCSYRKGDLTMTTGDRRLVSSENPESTFRRRKPFKFKDSYLEDLPNQDESRLDHIRALKGHTDQMRRLQVADRKIYSTQQWFKENSAA